MQFTVHNSYHPQNASQVLFVRNPPPHTIQVPVDVQPLVPTFRSSNNANVYPWISVPEFHALHVIDALHVKKAANIETRPNHWRVGHTNPGEKSSRVESHVARRSPVLRSSVLRLFTSFDNHNRIDLGFNFSRERNHHTQHHELQVHS